MAQRLPTRWTKKQLPSPMRRRPHAAAARMAAGVVGATDRGGVRGPVQPRPAEIRAAHWWRLLPMVVGALAVGIMSAADTAPARVRRLPEILPRPSPHLASPWSALSTHYDGGFRSPRSDQLTRGPQRDVMGGNHRWLRSDDGCVQQRSRPVVGVQLGASRNPAAADGHPS